MKLFEEERKILDSAIQKNKQMIGKKKINNPDIKDMISIVENFLRRTKNICYGGTAINNILPLEDQFYDRNVELPDYDFFSTVPLKHAKKLADIYKSRGFSDVIASAGIHTGTYKVFVNFIPVADITYMPPEIFHNLQKDALIINGIKYSPPNFLRMLGFLELSRPEGDMSRWDKVLQRINLLNKHYPLKGINCESIDIQRLYGADHAIDETEKLIFETTRSTLIDNGVVFFGALASKMILRYLPQYKKQKIPNVPDFDVLAEDPQDIAFRVKERLNDAGVRKVHITRRKPAGDIIGEHYEVIIDKETIVIIYKPLGCLSYNTLKQKGKTIRIATIDTLLNLYLAFLYTDRPYFDDRRILCISELMFQVQQKNRLKQKGLLKRFGHECYGEQKTLEDIRAEKSDKFKELKAKNASSWEREKYFLRYMPESKSKKRKRRPKRRSRRKKRLKKKTIFNIY